jgi:hypothetical protein
MLHFLATCAHAAEKHQCVLPNIKKDFEAKVGVLCVGENKHRNLACFSTPDNSHWVTLSGQAQDIVALKGNAVSPFDNVRSDASETLRATALLVNDALNGDRANVSPWALGELRMLYRALTMAQATVQVPAGRGPRAGGRVDAEDQGDDDDGVTTMSRIAKMHCFDSEQNLARAIVAVTAAGSDEQRRRQYVCIHTDRGPCCVCLRVMFALAIRCQFRLCVTSGRFYNREFVVPVLRVLAHSGSVGAQDHASCFVHDKFMIASCKKTPLRALMQHQHGVGFECNHEAACIGVATTCVVRQSKAIDVKMPLASMISADHAITVDQQILRSALERNTLIERVRLELMQPISNVGTFRPTRRLVRDFWVNRARFRKLCIHVSTSLSATDANMLVALAIALDLTISVHAVSIDPDAAVVRSALVWRGRS